MDIELKNGLEMVICITTHFLMVVAVRKVNTGVAGGFSATSRLLYYLIAKNHTLIVISIFEN